MEKWKILSHKTVFQRKIYRIDELACEHPVMQRRHEFTVMHTPDWINIIAVTADGRFIMVRQHRLGTDEFTIETPAGLVEDNEDLSDAAVRELREETGYSPSRIYHLKTLKANPAIMNTRLHLYAAEDCTLTHPQELDDSEDIEVVLFRKNEIDEMIRFGVIDHSVIIAAFSIYFLNKRKHEL
ncbi:MAG: NUDIX hydrolase [Spirochaetota bacterium]